MNSGDGNIATLLNGHVGGSNRSCPVCKAVGSRVGLTTRSSGRLMRRVGSSVTVGFGPSKLKGLRCARFSRGFICDACRSVGNVETRDRRRTLTLTTPLDVLTCRGSLQVARTPNAEWSSRFLPQRHLEFRFGRSSMPITRDGRTSGSQTAPAATSGSGSEQRWQIWAGLALGRTWSRHLVADKPLFSLGNWRKRWCIQPIGY